MSTFSGARACVPVQTMRGAERRASGLPSASQDGCMVPTVKMSGAGAVGPGQPGRWRGGAAHGTRRSPPAPATVVTNEQIRALVAAAQRLGQRQRTRCADAGTVAAGERLLRLDWVVRTGRLVLADRAAPRLASTAGSARRRREDL